LDVFIQISLPKNVFIQISLSESEKKGKVMKLPRCCVHAYMSVCLFKFSELDFMI